MDTKLLIVDDDKNICELIGLYLNKEGYEPIFAYDGAEAVEKFKDESKRVVCLDIMKYSAAVTIKIENYCDASPEFINGLPVTGKDKSYHGYGMKSIKMTVEK